MPKVMKRSAGSNFLIYFFACLLFLVIFFPFYWIVVTSFKDTMAIYDIPPQLFPKKIDFTNYALAFQKYNVGRYFANSIKVALVTVVFTTILGSFAAFALARLQFVGSKTIQKFLGTTQMFPVVVLLVPLFIFCNSLKLYNSLTSIILPYIALQLPVSIILQMGYYRDVPKALEEASTIDGCSTMQILWYVFLPLVTPGIVATAVYTFIQVWQEFLIASSFITNRKGFTLTVGLTTFKGDEMVDWGALMATSVVIAIPALILFNFAQDFFINKLAGSVKE